MAQRSIVVCEIYRTNAYNAVTERGQDVNRSRDSMRNWMNLKSVVWIKSASAGVKIAAHTFPQRALLGIEQGIAVADVFFNKIRIVAYIVL